MTELDTGPETTGTAMADDTSADTDEQAPAADVDAAGDTGGAGTTADGGTGDDSGRRWPTRLRAALPWVLVVAALAAAAVSTWQWQQLRRQAAAREDVRVATSSFMSTLTDWDASEGLDSTREALREAGTGPFLEQVDEFFGRMTGQLAATVGSEGRVRNVYVQELSGDSARSFAVVVQTITRDGDEATTVRYADLTLRRVEGEWLVAEIRLLADDAQPGAAGPAAPTAEPTATPTAGATAPAEEATP